MNAPGVLLIGHGSTRHPDSAEPILRLAQALRSLGPWSKVEAAFLRQDPPLEGAIDRLATDRVAVLPVFAGRGSFTEDVIPRRLGLAGLVTRRNGQEITYLPPLGSHPGLPERIIGQARKELLRQFPGTACEQAALLLVAHGSSRPGGAGKTPQAIADSIAARLIFRRVVLTFLEQAPFARDWRALTGDCRVVAVPLLIAPGRHLSRDIPELLRPQADERHPLALAPPLDAATDLLDLALDMIQRG